MFQPSRTRQFVTPARPVRPRAVFPPAAEAPLNAQAARLTEALNAGMARARGPRLVNAPLTFMNEGVLVAEEALYAALGAAAAGQLEAVRGTLTALFAFQRADGCLPSRLRPATGWRAKLAVWLGQQEAEALTVACYAGGVVATAMTLWLGAAYAEVTGDRQFLQDHKAACERALAWLATQERDGLVADELYANVLYFRALRAMGEMAVPRGEAIDAARYWARAAALRERVNTRFWEAGRGRYAQDADGRANLLAAAFGLAAPGQSQAILAQTDDGFGLSAAGFLAYGAASLGDVSRARQALETAPANAAEAGRCWLAFAQLNAAPLRVAARA